jgi:hypothetical protein
VKVAFKVTYAGLPSGGYVIITVIQSNSSAYVRGSGTSTPDACLSNSGLPFSGYAVCYFSPASSSGTESVSFTLNLQSFGRYNFIAGVGLADQNVKTISSSESASAFMVTVASPVPEFPQATIWFMMVCLIVAAVIASRKRSP